jgi:protein-S-isoprenylcysteine O-methyltransferase Ste14
LDICTAILIVVSSTWGILEAYLILRDRGRPKARATLDAGTRHYNFLAMTLSPIVAAIVTAIPGVNALGLESSWLFGFGTAIMLLGLGLRIWSVAVLGQYFRTTIELNENQKVVQAGPYRYIRHPSYTGLILTCIGYGLALQNIVSFVFAVTFPTIVLLHRIKVEEATLARGMGAEYVLYQKRTKKLIPSIW